MHLASHYKPFCKEKKKRPAPWTFLRDWKLNRTMVRRGTEGGNSLGTFFLFLFYGRLSLKTTPDVRRYSNSRAIVRLLSVINSSLCTIAAARREYIRCDSCMMTSSDDSIRR